MENTNYHPSTPPNLDSQLSSLSSLVSDQPAGYKECKEATFCSPKSSNLSTEPHKGSYFNDSCYDKHSGNKHGDNKYDYGSLDRMVSCMPSFTSCSSGNSNSSFAASQEVTHYGDTFNYSSANYFNF